MKNAKGDTVPRPLGTMLVPEFAGEVLMSDYIEIGPSDEGFVFWNYKETSTPRFMCWTLTQDYATECCCGASCQWKRSGNVAPLT